MLIGVPLIIEGQLDIRARNTVSCRGKIRLKLFKIMQMLSRFHIIVDEASDGYLCMLTILLLSLNFAKSRAEARIELRNSRRM